MMTALLAARNILGLGNFDTWKVNTDAEYCESASGDDSQKTGRSVPQRALAAGQRTLRVLSLEAWWVH